ncbi:hypothetical protein [Croceicoccus naphthovorans]|uniref:Uncharacterized protein n=1 Tax=Croceicoccus naphthovorans TaxID=1348774 RepID=A0A0G3XMC1_9SPHN|nr:hypothetical protein [Croceicoccus naphthovorans]AKM11819.1 hypothetical protein AB433_12710 [Croceicoccus naphthovorans]MBB3988857.1 hypothetical protein [Croceicoccus naphthovorans]
MQSFRIGLYLAAASGLALGACSQNEEAAAPTPETATETTVDHSDPIASAMSAGPRAVGEGATILAPGADGTMETLREGTNGWTCIPDNPATPGPDPMCMDANALKWAAAWMGKEEPPAETPGFMYMLQGGFDASNTDPYATEPDGSWIETGPHVMIVGSMKALEGYPSDAKPDTSLPYVMWAGTPYAHLMIPVE